LTGKMVKGLKTNIFGLRPRPDGTISFDGFTQPSELAAVVTEGAAPAGTPSAPTITPPAGTPPAGTPPAGTPPAAPAAPAPGAAASPAVTADTPRITNDAAGREAWGKLAPGTVYVAPDGSVRTKE
jgi:hypothetical protein